MLMGANPQGMQRNMLEFTLLVARVARC